MIYLDFITDICIGVIKEQQIINELFPTKIIKIKNANYLNVAIVSKVFKSEII